MSEPKTFELCPLPDHLPADLPSQLKICVEILLENPLPVGMVWLYGSYARGDYTRRHEPAFDGKVSVYRSDIDLLILLEDINVGGRQKKLELAKKPLRRIHKSKTGFTRSMPLTARSIRPSQRVTISTAM